MLQQGVSLYTVSKILGHSSILVTERYYAHVAQEDLRAGLDALNNTEWAHPEPDEKGDSS